jgi:hypothetical protein
MYAFFLLMFLSPKTHKKKIRHGKFDLFQFMLLFFAPIFVIPAFYFLKRVIVSNPNIGILNFPAIIFDLIFIMFLYLLILGNGIHSVSVILQKHMKDLRNHDIWKINEFFHNSFSHMLMTIPSVLILFLYVLLEINHPTDALLGIEIIILLFCGALIGIGTGIACTEGSIPRRMFYVLYILSLAIPFIFISNGLNYKFYPFSTFMEVVYVFSVITLSFYKYRLNGFPEIVPHYFFDEK